MKKQFKILITGIGCVGKTYVRKKIYEKYPDKIYSIDLESDLNHSKMPPENIKKGVIVIESVHGLYNAPTQYDKILYLLPPENYFIRWLTRGWSWFSIGTVDLAMPKGRKKKYYLMNIPVIIKILVRNWIFRRKWVKNDLKTIKRKLRDKTAIVHSPERGVNVVARWVSEYLNSTMQRSG